MTNEAKGGTEGRFLRVPLTVSQRTDISPTAKLLFGALAMHAGGNRPAYPNQATLATELGLKERRIRDAVRELADQGLVEVQRRRFRGAKGVGNLYWLRCPNRQDSASDHRQDSASGKEQMKRNYDLDYLPTHRKQRDTQADPRATDWQSLSALAERLLGRRPTRASLGRIISAAPTKTEAEAIEAIEAAERSGYDAEHKHGPRSVSWFVSVVQNYWADILRRALPPPAACPTLDPAAFERMTRAFDPLEDAA